MGYTNLRTARALAQGNVEIVVGTSHKIVRSGGRAGTHYYVKIGSVTFNVEANVYEAFQEGINYQIYSIALLGNTIVAAELALVDAIN